MGVDGRLADVCQTLQLPGKKLEQRARLNTFSVFSVLTDSKPDLSGPTTDPMATVAQCITLYYIVLTHTSVLQQRAGML